MSLRNLTFVALLWAFALNASLPTANAAERREPFELRDGDRVVLLGGTFFERAQRYGYLETALQLRFPDRKFSVRNLGWSADTVFAESRGIFDAPDKGYARMIEQVKGLKPTVIFLHYGGNESFNGEAYLDTFIKQYEKLLDDLTPTGADFVLVSPRQMFDLEPPYPNTRRFNQTRRHFSHAVKLIAAQQNATFIDISDLVATNQLELTDDGRQLNERGYELGSGVFSWKLLGLPSGFGPERIELQADGTVVNTERCDVDLIKATKDSLTFNVKFSVPSQSWASLKVNGLPKGTYRMLLDGEPLKWELTSEMLAQDFSGRSNRKSTPSASIFRNYGPLREAVIEKNQMYFHRWRPQNVTYLFLFRKHEQGNNAKEVEEFEQIVAKLDDRIFELKQKATEVTVEIVRVGDVEAGQ